MQKYNKIKNDVVMFSPGHGHRIDLALLPLLRTDNMVAAPASQDAFWVREQNLFPVIEPYQIDAINAMDYLDRGRRRRARRSARSSRTTSTARPVSRDWSSPADRARLRVAVTPRYKLGDQDFTAQVNELKNDELRDGVRGALPTEFGKILGTAAGLGLTPRWVAQSPAWVDALATTPYEDYLEEHVWVLAQRAGVRRPRP